MKSAILAFAVLVLLISPLAFSITSSAGGGSSASSVSSYRPVAVSIEPVAATAVEISPYPVAVAVSTSSSSVSACIDEELNSEVRRLYSMLSEGDLTDEQRLEIKFRIENVTAVIREKKESCVALQKSADSSICDVSSLSQELSRLALKLKEAEQNGDASLIEQVRNRKEEIMRLIREKKEQCASQPVTTAFSGGSIAMGAIASCQNLEKYKDKMAYLESTLSSQDNTEERISAIKADIETVRQYVARYQAECNERVSSNLGNLVSEAVKEKEGGASEIVAYYKTRLSAVISSGSDTGTQIQQLKQLRDEIDAMIRDLIEKQQSIDASEVSSVVSEIKVTPGEISADEVRVVASDKKIVAVLKNNPVEITNNGNSVMLDSDGISAEADELMITNETILVGNSEVGISPSTVVSSLNIVPKKIEIIEEGNRSVYKIRADERRNMLGLIAINMEKKVSVDGMNGSVISQEMPWWSFLTTANE